MCDYPLHRLVWANDFQGLQEALAKDKESKEQIDTRGRTPLMLAVTLGHLESTRVLLQFGTNVNVINKGGWTVVQEAVATGDPELLKLVLERRDRQRYTNRVGGIPELLQKLKNAPDFYVEMNWQFTSWVPFLSRMCPSDTYKVYKQGSMVRIDTTLLGFDQTNWVRGNRTYIFSGRENGADLYEVDHDTRRVYCEEMKILSLEELEEHAQSDEQISSRLVTPLVLTYLDTDKINFERSKGGFWGWGGDKLEVVSGRECKVFSAHNVELVTKTRTEHLTEEDKKRAKQNKNNPLHSFLGMAEVEVKEAVGKDKIVSETSEHYSVNNPCCISPEEYFSDVDLKGRDIGRPKEITSKMQKFHAQLWLCEDYPLSLQEQVMPIVDLMAISNTHFQKLKDFITCSFPAGFPVKIEIPLFHVLNAKITFGNIFGLDEGVEGITVVKEDDRTSCVVSEDVFEIPEGYSRIGGQSSNQVRRQYEDDDDQLLQYAIRQSMLEDERLPEAIGREEVDIWEALQAQAPSSGTPNLPTKSYADRQLGLQIQRAIELSLSSNPSTPLTNPLPNSNPIPVANDESDVIRDDDLALAIQMSKMEDEEKRKREEEEDDELKKILELSLMEK